MIAQQEHYDAADRLRSEKQKEMGGCFAPAGSTCDETHCECAQIAFDQVIENALAVQSS